MGIMDRTGRNLHLGQMVSMPYNGMITGQVVEINDTNLTDGAGNKLPKYVGVVVQLALPIDGNMCGAAYIIKEAPKEASAPILDSNGNVVPFGPRNVS